MLYYHTAAPGSSAVGSARGLGPRGRRFESCLPDQEKCCGHLVSTFFYG